MVAWFGIVLGCAVAAGELLAQAERPDGSTAIDSSITSWMVAHRAAALTAVARVLSAIGSQKVLTPLAGVFIVLLLARRRVWPALVFAVAWGGAIGLYNLAKHFVHRSRPPAGIHLTSVASSSFPSGHATQSWPRSSRWRRSQGLAISRVARRPGARARGRARCRRAGWSRVYLGVHWTTDVIAGWLIGAGWVSVVLWLAGRFRPHARPNGAR